MRCLSVAAAAAIAEERDKGSRVGREGDSAEQPRQRSTPNRASDAGASAAAAPTAAAQGPASSPT